MLRPSSRNSRGKDAAFPRTRSDHFKHDLPPHSTLPAKALCDGEMARPVTYGRLISAISTYIVISSTPHGAHSRLLPAPRVERRSNEKLQ
jgi:hypothetical protein